MSVVSTVASTLSRRARCMRGVCDRRSRRTMARTPPEYDPGNG
jgi:hypothetical protein